MGRSGGAGGGAGRPSGGFSGGPGGGGGRSAGRPMAAGGPRGGGPRGGGPRGGGPGPGPRGPHGPGPHGRPGGPDPHRPHRRFGGFWSRPFFGGGPRGGCGGGCLGGALGIIVVVLVVVALFGSLLTSCVGGFHPFGSGGASYSAASLKTSDTVREKLSSDAVALTAYYTDADGGWIQSASTLEEGLSEFYERTGVQPYVYILPNGETDSADELADEAVSLYDELFSDEGHFLLVFCDDDEGSYTWGYAMGTLVGSVMDSEALSVLSEELSSAYYDYSLSEEEIFSQAFANTAERIMSAAETEARDRAVGTVAVVAVVVVVAGVAVIWVVRRRQQQDDEQRRRVEDILNTPYERYADKDIEDLADKYEDE